MCDTSPSNIGTVLNKGDRVYSVTTAKVLTAGGLQGVQLYDSVAVVTCLKKYNPERLEQFLEFGLDEGLAQMANVPVAP